MKYCVKCGAELCDEAVVCPKCGCMVDGRLVEKDSPEKSKKRKSNLRLPTINKHARGYLWCWEYLR